MSNEICKLFYLPHFDALKINLKSGYYLRKKDRASEIRRFQFGRGSTASTPENDVDNPSLEQVLSAENIEVRVYTLTDVTTGTDNYTAEQTLQAYYGQIDLDIYDFLSLTGVVLWKIWQINALYEMMNKTYPHLNYQLEPQAYNNCAHGDLWDYLYSQSLLEKTVFHPLMLEMGSWRWLRKHALQIFNSLSVFYPVKTHRVQRTFLLT